jgi:hypothetical protein
MPNNSAMSFGRTVLSHWNGRRKKIEHEYAIAWWALSVVGEVPIDVREQMRGEHRDAIECVIRRLYVDPCANSHPDIRSMSEAEIIDTFWNEFKAFHNCLS